MTSIAFTKMHGTGNDFMVVDNRDGQLEFVEQQIRSWSDRHFGIGFDQMLIVQAPSTDDAEFDYRIFNADGGEVEHCGNGARCFAKYVTDNGFTNSTDIPVNTNAGRINLRVRNDGMVTVKMGIPEFSPAKIPFLSDAEALSYKLQLTSPTADKSAANVLEIGAVAIGNPHAVTQVDSVDLADVADLGPQIESHNDFPNRVNAGFMEIINASNIRLRVYERGVGETRACGTGACGAVAVGVRQKILERRVKVQLSGGELEVYWPDDKQDIEMTGPCTKVFEGHIEM